MILTYKLRPDRNGIPLYTLYTKKKVIGYSLASDEIVRHGLKLHFESYNNRLHLTVEMQAPPEGYTYSRLVYKHKDISKHNYCRANATGKSIIDGIQYHQIQTRYWLPRVVAILRNPNNFRAIYTKQ